ncbi:hypothetical protein V6Z12_D11G171700 [Gossypium hirsutum]
MRLLGKEKPLLKASVFRCSVSCKFIRIIYLHCFGFLLTHITQSKKMEKVGRHSDSVVGGNSI